MKQREAGVEMGERTAEERGAALRRAATDGPSAAYWARSFGPAAVAGAAAKYQLLSEVTGTGPDAQTRTLRAAAARWPGSLREARRTSRTVYLARMRATTAALAAPGQSEPRSAWRARGLGAVVLWWDLHGLVADIQAWRATRSAASDRHAVAAFVAFARTPRPGRVSGAWSWPAAAEVLDQGGPVGVRLAEFWLCRAAGLMPHTLSHCLAAGERSGAA